VADDKGELLTRVFAVDAWRRTHGRPPVGVKFVFEGNEETGGTDLIAFARKPSDRLQADGCIWEYGDKDPAGIPQMYLRRPVTRPRAGLRHALHVGARRAESDVAAGLGAAHAQDPTRSHCD